MSGSAGSRIYRKFCKYVRFNRIDGCSYQSIELQGAVFNACNGDSKQGQKCPKFPDKKICHIAGKCGEVAASSRYPLTVFSA
jgi:hypothetical protein